MTTQAQPVVRIRFQARNNRLLLERERRGLTQVQMAALCGVCLVTYWRAEKLGRISRECADKIVAIVGGSTEEVFPAWTFVFGEVINKPEQYLLLDDNKGAYLAEAHSGDAFLPPKLLSESYHRDLDNALNQLKPKEAEVVRLCFGLGREHPLTLVEIADRFNLTRERIHQIKQQALRRLQHNPEITSVLRQYLGADFERCE